jgi:hypothetical protein
MKKKESIVVPIESPTWSDLQTMAEAVIEKLGGPKEASKKLGSRNYYTLALCSSLILDEEKGGKFLLGKQWLS